MLGKPTQAEAAGGSLCCCFGSMDFCLICHGQLYSSQVSRAEPCNFYPWSRGWGGENDGRWCWKHFPELDFVLDQQHFILDEAFVNSFLSMVNLNKFPGHGDCISGTVAPLRCYWLINSTKNRNKIHSHISKHQSRIIQFMGRRRNFALWLDEVLVLLNQQPEIRSSNSPIIDASIVIGNTDPQGHAKVKLTLRLRLVATIGKD
jgi:hypothetical protein